MSEERDPESGLCPRCVKTRDAAHEMGAVGFVLCTSCLAARDQEAPRHNTSRPIGELVLEDINARIDLGQRRYGTKLQANNGRDALMDAYQEAIDLVMYLRQAIAERDAR